MRSKCLWTAGPIAVSLVCALALAAAQSYQQRLAEVKAQALQSIGALEKEYAGQIPEADTARLATLKALWADVGAEGGAQGGHLEQVDVGAAQWTSAIRANYRWEPKRIKVVQDKRGLSVSCDEGGGMRWSHGALLNRDFVFRIQGQYQPKEDEDCALFFGSPEAGGAQMQLPPGQVWTAVLMRADGKTQGFLNGKEAAVTGMAPAEGQICFGLAARGQLTIKSMELKAWRKK